MARSTVTLCRIVNYTGSKVFARGFMLYGGAMQGGGHLLRFTFTRDERLEHVRDASFTFVEVPAFTEDRIEALRDLVDHVNPPKIDRRALNWLLAQKLVEETATEHDETVRPRVTQLGYAVAQAHRNR